MTIVVGASDELEHQPQASAFVALPFDVNRKVTDSIPVGVGFESQHQRVATRRNHPIEHRHRWLTRSGFIRGNHGLTRASQVCELSLGQPGG